MRCQLRVLLVHLGWLLETLFVTSCTHPRQQAGLILILDCLSQAFRANLFSTACDLQFAQASLWTLTRLSRLFQFNSARGQGPIEKTIELLGEVRCMDF